MKYDFDGKKVLVTGAGQGLGRAIAIALHNWGADVYALSKTAENLESLKQEIGGDGKRFTSIRYDLSDVTNLENAIKPFLPFHFLVNNAGINIFGNVLDITAQNYDQVLNVNTKAPLFLTQIVAKSMVENKINGAIVNVSSQASKMMIDQHCAYTLSKAALDSLTKFSAWEFGKYGIRVNSVNPTVVFTELGKIYWSEPARAEPMLNKIPLHKFAEVQDVVNAVMFLLSDESCMTTGLCLPVDGGATI